MREVTEFRKLYLKNGVNLGQGTLFQAECVARLLDFWPHELCDLVITAGRDGKHGDKSYHYSGRAFDIRTRDIPELDRKPIHETLKEKLGRDYDCILEKDHIHIEPSPGSWLLNEAGKNVGIS